MASAELRELLDVSLSLGSAPQPVQQTWGFTSIDSFLPSAGDVQKSKALAPHESRGSVLREHCVVEGEVQARLFFSLSLSLALAVVCSKPRRRTRGGTSA